MTTAATWRKSSHSITNGDCIEVGGSGGVVGVRDSKFAESPVLAFPAASWAAFTAGVKDAPQP